MPYRTMLACAAIWLPTLTLPGLAAQPAYDSDPPDLSAIIASPRSEMADVVRRFDADEGALARTYWAEASAARRERFEKFYDGWLASMGRVSIDGLGLDGKVDYVLLHNAIERARARLKLDGDKRAEAEPFAPFAPIIAELTDARRRLAPLPPDQAAARLNELKMQVEAAQKLFEEKLKPVPGGETGQPDKPGVTATTSKRALDYIESLRGTLGEWHNFSNGYDPEFTWWNAEPFRAADAALDAYAKVVREKGVGVTPENPHVIVGTPIGREALLAELKFEMIPYTPEELLAIAEREFAWCEAELKKASNEMGLSDDWKTALERVKQTHLKPGEQPGLIRDLALEAIAFLKEKDLVTVPPLAEETWRMEMMTPERQLVTPFFTGGEVVSVSFPVASMAHEQKLMSLRGNNIHFSRATVFHELIPGHHLQQFANSRNKIYRGTFSTPFWTEGWALYWEMLLWDRGFPKTPENRVGMLFWRSHRCARIIFSIRYQLGEMSPQECVDFLVDRVGHERANAEGEVRRSVSGGYGPLYQVAYMIGGLQFRALHRELVGSGRMTDRQFHDAVLRENNIPIEMVRAMLMKEAPARDFTTRWRFDEANAGVK